MRGDVKNILVPSISGHAKATIRKLSRSLVLEFWAENLTDVILERNFQLPARYELAIER
jgi:hypothetical protein